MKLGSISTLGLVSIVGLVIGIYFVLAHRYDFQPSKPSFAFLQRENTKAEKSVPNTLEVSDVSIEELETLTIEQTQQEATHFLGVELVSAVPIKKYSLSYTINVEDDQKSEVKSIVYVPQMEDEKDIPLVVYGPGTTGIDDRCAPLLESEENPDMGNFDDHMIAMASQGMVMVLPNYEGFNNPERIQYYFQADLEARALLGAAIAANQTNQLPIADNTAFFGGYSQGGHAAFAVADKAEAYWKEGTIAGVFGHGPTTNTIELLKFNPNLAPYLVYAYQDYYPSFSAKKILSKVSLAKLDTAKELCVNEAFQYNTSTAQVMYNKNFLSALNSDQLPAKYSEIYDALSKNNSGTEYTKTPTLILQGEEDPIIPLENQQAFADQACQRGVPVTFSVYEDLDHFAVRATSFDDTNNWIKSVFNGNDVDMMCN